MSHSHIPVSWGQGWRRAATVLTALTAFMGMALIAGPAASAVAGPYCALPLTGAHHSVGTDRWNPDYPRPERTLDAAMVFLSFPDARPSASPEQLTADHFPATSQFFDRASYGRFSLRAHPAKRWLRMPSASGHYGIQRDWDPDRRAEYLRDAVRTADPHLDFSRYDIVYLVADPDAPGVNSDATKVVTFGEPMEVDGTPLHRLVTVFEQSPPDRNVLAHETGHAFDLPDLYERPEDGATGDWDTYVGDWSLMGSQFGLAPDLFGWEKWKVGWLQRRNVACLPTRAGAARAILQPLGRARLGGIEDKRLAVVRTGLHEALVLEVRDGGTTDRTTCRRGVLAYWVHSDKGSTGGPIRVADGHPGSRGCAGTSVQPGLADAPLGVGETLRTERGGGLRIAVTGRSDDGGWKVKVRRDTGMGAQP